MGEAWSLQATIKQPWNKTTEILCWDKLQTRIVDLRNMARNMNYKHD